MSRQPGLSEWIDLVSTHMPHLSVPQARVLALWSYGMALTRSCGRLTVATFLALLMRQKVATVEQRLYEWCCPAAHKAGGTRQTVEVTTCFVPLMRWIVTLWASTHLALALDATSLGIRFVVLTVRVVYRGCAIPVAWTVLPANQPGAWRREWLRLLRQVRPAIPADVRDQGVVLAAARDQLGRQRGSEHSVQRWNWNIQRPPRLRVDLQSDRQHRHPHRLRRSGIRQARHAHRLRAHHRPPPLVVGDRPRGRDRPRPEGQGRAPRVGRPRERRRQAAGRTRRAARRLRNRGVRVARRGLLDVSRHESRSARPR